MALLDRRKLAWGDALVYHPLHHAAWRGDAQNERNIAQHHDQDTQLKGTGK